MFSKILIANRGEIACRIITTARRMGIATVAVYSDADARAPFVKMADEAVHIGPSSASESYLKIEKIIAACKETGAQAVHPGYGFLSERAGFVEALKEEGIAFIGPPAGAIAAMGDKIEAKTLAQRAGVPVVPGFIGAIDDARHAISIVREIGYPVMMKASAGGGGKGMRIAYSDQDVHDGFAATKREGLNSFGDDRVFIEKFIEDPRHIEIQILGDQHGNLVYLNERECSIQRRHQKVVEEAPSPFVTPQMRKAMGEQCLALARAVDYHSAGTVELIVSGADPSGESFYFLEMNTRLQVEHPVTEAITGIDLVEQMIRVAAGERLAIRQEDIGIDGWSIETRLYAEDPYRGFLPSTGRLVYYQPPVRPWGYDGAANGRRGIDGVRVDDGVREGGEVSIFYDPMIAKLITWGKTRDDAADLQLAALDNFRIEGLGHNADFLSALMQHARFRSGDLTTGFITEEYPDGFAGAAVPDTLLALLAGIAASLAHAHEDRANAISAQLADKVAAASAHAVRIGDMQCLVTLTGDGAVVNGEAIAFTHNWQPGATSASVSQPDGKIHGLKIARETCYWLITTHGRTHRIRVLPARLAEHASHMIAKAPPDTSNMLLCPMPGLLVSLHVAEGDVVQPGQPLATVEAMKMENILRAEKSGTIAKINASQGETLMVDAVIMELAE